MTERIVAAALRAHGVTLSLERPARHNHIFTAMFHAGQREFSLGAEQGFLTSEGRFVARPEALKIAIEAGQDPKMENAPYLGLFSEDLW